MTNIAGLLVQLSQASGAEVMYKDEIGCIEVFGTERDVRNVYQRVHEMAFLKVRKRIGYRRAWERELSACKKKCYITFFNIKTQHPKKN